MGKNEAKALIDVFLEKFRETAEKLMKGLPVSEDEEKRYNGLMGLMFVNVYESLWSPEDLQKTVDERIRLRCLECGGGEGKITKKRFAYFGDLIVKCKWPLAVVFSLALYSPHFPKVLAILDVALKN